MGKENILTEETKKGLMPYTQKELLQITRDVFCQYLADVKGSEAKPIEPINKIECIKFPIIPIEGYCLKGDKTVYPLGDTSETIRVSTWKCIDYRTQLTSNGDGDHGFNPETVDTQVTFTRCAQDGSEQILLFTSNYNLVMCKGEERANLVEFLNDRHTEVDCCEDGSVKYVAYDKFASKENVAPGFVSQETFDSYENKQPVTVQESIDLHNALVANMVATPEMFLSTMQNPDPCM